jgi:uncharacterized cupredoxin-like copper-binding protein
MHKHVMALTAVAVVSILVVGCGDDDDNAAGTIDVTLSDFQIELSDTSAPAGNVTFAVDNEGPSTHEFVVFQTDLEPDALPTDDNGDVAESDEFAPVDEIEDIEEGATPELTVDLAAGNYVLLCNVTGHFENGMVTTFTVT